MTENEAIEAIQFDLKIGGEIHSQVLRDAIDVAIQALETIKKLSDRNMTTEVLENYMQFEDECVKKGFTFKSVIEAREKQMAKKPMRIERSAMGWEYRDYYCPCGKFIGAEPHIKSILEKGEIPVKYCDDCGQELDWSDKD